MAIITNTTAIRVHRVNDPLPFSSLHEVVSLHTCQPKITGKVSNIMMPFPSYIQSNLLHDYDYLYHCVLQEISSVFRVYGIAVDCHLSLIADYMTFDGTYKPLVKDRGDNVQSTYLHVKE